GIRFQVLFHSPPGVLFTFPSRYFFTIGHQVVFSLERWSSQLHTRLHVSRATPEHNYGKTCFVYRTITFCGRPFQIFQLQILTINVMSTTLNTQMIIRFGCSPFARRYYDSRVVLLSLRALRCFSSSRLPAFPSALGR